jgi:hypothetical protein
MVERFPILVATPKLNEWACHVASCDYPYKGIAEFSQTLIAEDTQLTVRGIVVAVNLSKHDRMFDKRQKPAEPRA